jgi:hypothetical protein
MSRVISEKELTEDEVYFIKAIRGAAGNIPPKNLNPQTIIVHARLEHERADDVNNYFTFLARFEAYSTRVRGYKEVTYRFDIALPHSGPDKQTPEDFLREKISKLEAELNGFSEIKATSDIASSTLKVSKKPK